MTERDFKANLSESPHFAEPAENDIIQQYLRQNTSSKFKVIYHLRFLKKPIYVTNSRF